MTKRGRTTGVIAVLLLAITGLILWLAPRWRERLTQRAERGRAGATPTAVVRDIIELPPLPNISLQIDRNHELVVYRGTPLLFEVRLANRRAINADFANHAERAYVETLKVRLSRGEIPKEQAATQLAALRGEHKSQPLLLGDEATGWEQFVHISQLLPDGKRQPLPWPLKLVAPPEAKTLTLDAKNTAQLDYLLDLVTAAQIPAGDYRILAAVEVPVDAKVAADRWRGRVESEPAKLTILPRPDRLTPEEEEKTHLQFARYYQAAKDWTHAQESAQKALAANPKSIPAHILVGEVKEAQGDLRGALEAFQTAQTEFYKQYPESYEAPLYLIYKSAELLAKLKGTP